MKTKGIKLIALMLLSAQCDSYSMGCLQSMSSYCSLGWSALKSCFSNQTPYKLAPTAKVSRELSAPEVHASMQEHRILIGQEQSCSVCLNEKQTEDFISLSCGHEYCVECLETIVDIAVLENKQTLSLKCPNEKCKKVITEADIRKITRDKKTLAAYYSVTLNEYLALHPQAKHCRTPNCSYVYMYEPVKCQGNPPLHKCPECKEKYCAQCLTLHPGDISCNQVKQSEQANNKEWINQNTKQCPKCCTRIEKSAGCDRMTCQKCEHRFCWLCFAPCPPGTKHKDELCQSNQRALVAKKPSKVVAIKQQTPAGAMPASTQKAIVSKATQVKKPTRPPLIQNKPTTHLFKQQQLKKRAQEEIKEEIKKRKVK